MKPTAVVPALVAAAVVGLAAPAASAATPPVVTGWAPAARAAVHPGVVVETPGAGTCTADFVFTDGPRVLLGEAAHCAGTGADTETDGCTAATLPDGTEVTVHGSDGRDRPGRLAYSSWTAMQAAYERDPGRCATNDFALVELADTADVNPSVPFFGGPTGLQATALGTGAPVLTYGNSTLRGGVAALRPKAGTTTAAVPGGYTVYSVTPGIPGDSGSGYLTLDGAAVGVLSTLNLAPLPVSNGVTDLAAATRYATTHGVAHLQLEPGTEPFTPNPAALLPQL